MSAETLEWWRLGFTILAFLLAAVANVFTWWSARTKARRDDVDGELNTISNRLKAAERDLHHSPTQAQVQEVHARVADVHGEMQNLSGQMQAVSHQMGLINEHLLNQSKRGGS